MQRESKNSKQVKAKKKGSQPARNTKVINDTRNVIMPVANLSVAVTNYARALSNPFTGPITGVPAYPSLLSQKVRVWGKGVFQCGTANCGYVVINPVLGIASDQVSIYATANNFTGTSYTFPAPTGVFGSNTNAPFTTAQIGPGATQACFRIVSCGLRIRYAGTELNRGGYVVGFVDPTQSGLGGRGIASIDGEELSRRFPVTREWLTLLYRPVVDTDLTYNDSASFAGNAANDWYMGFILDSLTSNAFEYEAFWVLEYQGRNVRGMTTTAHDPVGFAAVNHISQVSPHFLPNSTAHEVREGSVLAQVGHYITRGISYVAHQAVKEGQQYIEENGISGVIGAANKSLSSMSQAGMRTLPALLV